MGMRAEFAAASQAPRRRQRGRPPMRAFGVAFAGWMGLRRTARRGPRARPRSVLAASRLGAKSARDGRRCVLTGGRRDRINAWQRQPGPEHAERAAGGPCRRGEQDARVTLAPQPLAHGLVGGPVGARGRRRGQPDDGQPLVGVQCGDTVERDRVAPEVARQRLERRDGVVGQAPVPLSSARVLIAGEVQRGHDVASLPSPACGRLAAVGGIAARRNVAPPRSGNGDRRDVEAHRIVS
jgi:hypothetical protein